METKEHTAYQNTRNQQANSASQWRPQLPFKNVGKRTFIRINNRKLTDLISSFVAASHSDSKRISVIALHL